MPSVLLLGYPDICAAFGAAVPEAYTLYHLGEEAVDLNGRRAMPLVMGTALPADLVAIVDLYIDPIEKMEAVESLPVDLPADAILFTNILTVTATEVAAWFAGEHAVLGFSYIPELFAKGTLVEAAPAMQTSSDAAAAALDLLRALTGREVETLTDRVALVSARTLAMIINEAAFALMEGVADPADIDTAMKLGTNYPEGPLAWADRIGLDIIVLILTALHEEYQEERYRPCVLLKQYMRARKEMAGKG